MNQGFVQAQVENTIGPIDDAFTAREEWRSQARQELEQQEAQALAEGDAIGWRLVETYQQQAGTWSRDPEAVRAHADELIVQHRDDLRAQGYDSEAIAHICIATAAQAEADAEARAAMLRRAI